MKIFLIKNKMFILSILVVLVFFICSYKFVTINQPCYADLNSNIDISITVALYGADPSANEPGGTPYFGICLPIGWSVIDSITYGGSLSGTFIYSNTLSDSMESLESAPDGYYWWMSEGDTIDSQIVGNVSFTSSIHTDDQIGTFFIDYVLGDDKNGINFHQSNDYIIHTQESEVQPVAIIQNFPDVEIDMLRKYLLDLGLGSIAFSQNRLEKDSLNNFNLIIWDDVGYQMNGITDEDVDILSSAYELGIPLYFIGDDLAYSSMNLSQQHKEKWLNLINLTEGENYSNFQNFIRIINTHHPISNGPFGSVSDFIYKSDIDNAFHAEAGEIPIGTTDKGNGAISAHEHPLTGLRTVTQNVMVFRLRDYKEIPETSQDSICINEREKLFKNAIHWLMNITSIENPKNFSCDNKNKDYFINQNYPNPFNPSTTIEFTLPSSEDVRIEVFDITGQRIKMLLNKPMPAGKHEVEFSGQNLSSGVYLYWIEAGEFQDVKKMILLR